MVHALLEGPSSLSPAAPGRSASSERGSPRPTSHTLQSFLGQKRTLAASFQLLPPGIQAGQTLLGLKECGLQRVLSRPGQQKDRSKLGWLGCYAEPRPLFGQAFPLRFER